MKNRFRELSILLVFALFVISESKAQELQRKGSFGIQMEFNSEKKGIEVKKVFPNSTAENLKFQTGDILETINDVKYTNIGILIDSISTWNSGDKIEATVLRNSKLKKSKGLVVGKPLETSDYGTVSYGQVEFDGGLLRTILIVPKGIIKPPVVQFLPGVGCESIDFYYNPKSPIKMLVEEFVKNGIAVYRVEKPNMGDSKGCIPCESMDYNYEINSLKMALLTLKKSAVIDTKNIFLYGHSLGVISAPIIANDIPVQGILAWGGLSKTWFEYNLDIIRKQNTLKGMNPTEIEEELRFALPFLCEFFINKRAPAFFQKDTLLKEVASYYLNGEMWHNLNHYSYFQNLNDVNLLSEYEKVNCPVLAMAGEYDYHAINTDWAFDIAKAVNIGHEGKGNAIIIPKTTHHYHFAKSMEDYVQKRQAKQITLEFMSQNFNKELVELASNWIKEHIK